jgi:hypothetical protein
VLGVGSVQSRLWGIDVTNVIGPTLCCSQRWRSVAIPPSRVVLRVPDLWHALCLHDDGVAPLHDDTAIVEVGLESLSSR